ncbi:VCBS repeat-containing protein [Flavitalea sp.]|nr:VCBS repeat-containing protein [Flavitalea sp.]
MYYYNGSGVAAGDFNNDGKIDLFFAANQSNNRIYLNEGDLKFKDITEPSKIPQDGGWSTGVSVVDINNDGLLDIYISRVGNFHSLQSKNQFLICQGINAEGIPVYADKAKEYGLDYSGFSTQAAFLDIDMDGDLDMFLVNHTVHESGVYRPRQEFLGIVHPVSGARMFRNDGGHFTDFTSQSGINSSVIGYGLGIAVADINLDGFPDIYIGNDFHENDYLYINNGKGIFSEQITDKIAHTGRFTMGVDVADVNNDGHSEIISMDMLSDDPYILKRSLGEDDYDIFNLKISYGYQYQYTRNNLQYNRGNGYFSELGLYAGIAATDWSWSPLWIDFDNDGLKDLFISNGIPKRMNDIDYINFVSNEEIQRKLSPGNNKENGLDMIDKFPKIKIENKFFKNDGALSFSDIGTQVSNPKDTYSNGAVYADFDNDGDLDIVVNNIDESSLLYRNNFSENANQESNQESNQEPDQQSDQDPNQDFNPGKPGQVKSSTSGNQNVQPGTSFSISIKGDSLNKQAIGAKLIVCAGGTIRLYEKFGVHGFQSSIDIPFHVGAANLAIDSVLLIWPDNSYEKIPNERFSAVTASVAKISNENLAGNKAGGGEISKDKIAGEANSSDNNPSDNNPGDKNSGTYLPGDIILQYKSGLPKFDYSSNLFKKKYITGKASDITYQAGIEYKHVENVFAEFNREPLLPHMLSTEGPALAVGDLNGDGLDDIFLGAARDTKPSLWVQKPGGKFERSVQDALDNDSIFEDISACWVDVNKDGRQDLVVASGGNEFYGKSENLAPRVYINDGFKLTRKKDAFSDVYLTASVVVASDFNGDGFEDLFVGGRAVPMEYGRMPQSYLLQNDGKGRFTDVTSNISGELGQAGFVTSAIWSDIDKDGDPDLLLSAEWETLTAFINDKGKFTKQLLTDKKGWWNFMLPCDIDNDGDLDIIAGNLGLNSRLRASEKEPVSMYYYDFDGNARKEQLLTYYLNHKQIPFASIAELNKQIPVIRKKFLYAGDFAKATLPEIFDAEKLKAADFFQANYFSNAVLINNGRMQFDLKALPWEAQLTSFRDATVVNANNDSLPDVLLVGNYFESNTEMGRYDGDFGTVLINQGSGNFKAELLNGVLIKGQVRHIAAFRSNLSNPSNSKSSNPSNSLKSSSPTNKSKANDQGPGGKANLQYFIMARNNDSAIVISLPGPGFY